jgi:hypothetical protein
MVWEASATLRDAQSCSRRHRVRDIDEARTHANAGAGEGASGRQPDMAFTRMLSALLRGDVFTVHGSGQRTRDFTFAADVGAATIAAMDAPSPANVYNVSGGSETSLRDAIHLSEELVGRRLKVENDARAVGIFQKEALKVVLVEACSAPLEASLPSPRRVWLHAWRRHVSLTQFGELHLRTVDTRALPCSVRVRHTRQPIAGLGRRFSQPRSISSMR